jgi:hypothetical protein
LGDILGIGLTHYPLLAAPDERMSSLLRLTLRDPGIPASEKNQLGWPALMQQEWGHDRGLTAAAGHRAELLQGLATCRAAIDAFAPDALIVFGDDQYENFREEVVPPFCVLAYPDAEITPFLSMREFGWDNVWNLPDETSFTMRGAPDLARSITRGLMARGFDMSYSYRPRDQKHFPHAIANTQLYLDYENAGRKFGYPIVPVLVNCYGEHVISRRGGLVTFGEIAEGEVLDPPGPSPERCYELGQALARLLRESPHRVCIVASSSWSHAFLVDRAWHLRPDIESDSRLYDALVRGDIDAWRAITSQDIAASGQQEMLNWFCLLGAMTELGIPLSWSAFVQTYVFNSDKCFAIFGGGAA